MASKILVLYDPKGPAIQALAGAAAEGVSSAGGEAVTKSIYQAVTQDLLEADGLLLGSPNWSGLTGSMKSWLDEQGDLWGGRKPVRKTRRRLDLRLGPALRTGNDPAPVGPLDAGLRDGRRRPALVRPHAVVRLLLWRDRSRRGQRPRLGPSQGTGRSAHPSSRQAQGRLGKLGRGKTSVRASPLTAIPQTAPGASPRPAPRPDSWDLEWQNVPSAKSSA